MVGIDGSAAADALLPAPWWQDARWNIPLFQLSAAVLTLSAALWPATAAPAERGRRTRLGFWNLVVVLGDPERRWGARLVAAAIALGLLDIGWLALSEHALTPSLFY